MTDRLSVSVIVPLFNGGRFIAHALTSIADQTAVERGEVDLEVIVVDDGSSDDGAELAAVHSMRPTVIRQDRQGVAAARNRGAAAARGDWLTFLDQDDLWHASRLELIAPILASRQASFVVTSETKFGAERERQQLLALEPGLTSTVRHWISADSDIERIRTLELPPPHETSVGQRLTTDDLIRQTAAMSTPFFITAHHLRLIGGWSLHAKSIDDWWLMVNAARLEPLLRVDQPTALYRLHLDATSRSTQFFYPLASSLVALKFGGQLESPRSALVEDTRNLPVEHLVMSALRSPQFAADRGSVRHLWHMCHLLWPQKRWSLVFAKSRLRRALSKTRH